MALLNSLSPHTPLQNPSADFKTSVRAEQYRVSDRAIYFPAFPGRGYLPFAAVTAARVKPTALSLTGCCGKQLPMYRLQLWHDGGEVRDFLFEHEAKARAVLARIRRAFPEVEEVE